MNLVNYTTSISWQKSVAEAVGLLASAGAQSITQNFDGFGHTSAIAFSIMTQFGPVAFYLPMDVEKTQGALSKMVKAGKLPRRTMNDYEQARRVGWRIIRTWLEAQIALIQIGLVKVEQVFLPYAQNEKGETVFEAMEKAKFGGLLLPAPTHV